MLNNKLIVALDVSSKDDMFSLLKRVNQPNAFVKVGMELFFQEGPDIIKQLKERNYRIFLDLKCHDIPTTVYRTMKGLAKLGVDMVNVHAAGGAAMMRAAVKGLSEGSRDGKKTICLAVTQLTSTNDDMLHHEILIDKPMNEVIQAYSQLAYESGIDGVVCSPWEASLVKEATSETFVTVTPGIRLMSDKQDDQERVATPSKARELGSDYIVVGRSITQAEDPEKAYLEVQQQWGR
ncbi:orotidine-5'-phosphate decarboxylase [Terrilactibacillus sp. BCM23-1]|uniref:Orotidine 5'-phosphate decarboxylase n=1 Tax=Terrilactibacillus tamarindi TaxID=2599694 RepID=A0A6N8CPI7_9BACI|nr:orotidine-5'-phosphate decarboxylase [Terrilactibacillus tamarindi]